MMLSALHRAIPKVRPPRRPTDQAALLHYTGAKGINTSQQDTPGYNLNNRGTAADCKLYSGGGINLDVANGDYVDLGAALSCTNPYELFFIVKSNGSTGADQIVFDAQDSAGDGLRLYFDDAAGYLKFSHNGNIASATNTPLSNTWYIITVAHIGTYIKIRTFNESGTQLDNVTFANAWTNIATAANAIIGAESFGSKSKYFDGIIAFAGIRKDIAGGYYYFYQDSFAGSFADVPQFHDATLTALPYGFFASDFTRGVYMNNMEVEDIFGLRYATFKTSSVSTSYDVAVNDVPVGRQLALYSSNTLPYFNAAQDQNIDTGVQAGNTPFWLFMAIDTSKNQSDTGGSVLRFAANENAVSANKGFVIQVTTAGFIGAGSSIAFIYNNGVTGQSSIATDTLYASGDTVFLGISMSGGKVGSIIEWQKNGTYKIKSNAAYGGTADFKALSNIILLGSIPTRNLSGSIRSFAIGEGSAPTQSDWEQMYADSLAGRRVTTPDGSFMLVNRVGSNALADTEGDGAAVVSGSTHTRRFVPSKSSGNTDTKGFAIRNLWKPGRFNFAAGLHGGIQIGSTLGNMDAVAYSFIFGYQWHETGAVQTLFANRSSGDGITLIMDALNQMTFINEDGGIELSESTSDANQESELYTAAATFSDNSVILYQAGPECYSYRLSETAQEPTDIGAVSAGSAQAWIGIDPTGSNQCKFLITDLAIYNQVKGYRDIDELDRMFKQIMQ